MFGSNPVITVTALARHFNNTTVLDTTESYNPQAFSFHSERERYSARHIPGARFLDIEALAAFSQPYDTNLPGIRPVDDSVLQRAMDDAGITPETNIVLTEESMSGSYVRYMLKDNGFTNVYILDGGTNQWALEGYELTDRDQGYVDGRHLAIKRPYSPDLEKDTNIYMPADEMLWLRAYPDGSQIVDCRLFQGNEGILPDRYASIALPATHYLSSGAVNVEIDEEENDRKYGKPLLTQKFLSAAEGRDLLAEKNIADDRKTYLHCYFERGAANVATMMEIAGQNNFRIVSGGLMTHARRQGLANAPR